MSDICPLTSPRVAHYDFADEILYWAWGEWSHILDWFVVDIPFANSTPIYDSLCKEKTNG